MARFACSGFNSNGLNVAPFLRTSERKPTITVLHHHTAVVVEELNILRERTGRHIDLGFLRLLCRHSWLSAWNENAFGFLDYSAALDDSFGFIILVGFFSAA